MTTPNEELLALKNTREFLKDLLNPKKTPRVPSVIRKRAGSCLKHYPWNYYLEMMYNER